jgi:hypothetical protein
MTQQDFNCYNPASNPTGDVPPTHYKVFMCDWKGKIPVAFHGTWNLVSAPPGMCEDFPLTPTGVTFTRTTLDCEDSAFYAAPFREPPVPFVVAIIDPLVYEYRTLSEQAMDGVAILGNPTSGPTGDPPTGAGCSATTFTMNENFNNMDCKFTISLTGVSF